MDREVTVLQALQLGFRKGLRFYGRSSRPEFWKFFLFTWVMVAASVVLTRVPVVGSLLQAVIIIAILCCQYTACAGLLRGLNPGARALSGDRHRRHVDHCRLRHGALPLYPLSVQQ